MALRELVVSPPGTGKTTHCIELFKNRILKSKAGIDSRSYFVLPSREHAARIQSLVLKKDVPGLFNARILTIQDLADALLGGSGGGRPTDSARRALVAEALGAVDEAGNSVYGYFRDSIALRGFQDLAVEAVREFKAGMLTAGDFEKRAQPLLKDPVFRSKFRDFTILLKRYDAALEALGLAEAEDELARSGLDAGRSPELVIFDGFYHFTRFQKKLLELVSASADHTVVTLTLDRKHGAGEALFGYPERTRLFLRAAGFKESPPLGENHRTPHPALRHLATHLFSPRAEVYSGKPPAPVSEIAAPSRRVEYEMIAREIRRLYRDENCHFSDVCVILRAVSGRRALIESVFAEHGLPVAIHERNKLTESGLAMALHRYLRLPAEDWNREDVLYLAKSSYFRHALGLEDALEIERAALRENVQAGREGWRGLAASESLPVAARGFLSNLLEADERLRAAASAQAFGSLVRAFFEPLLARSADPEGIDAAVARAVATILAASRRRWTEAGRTFQADTAIRETLASLEEGLFSLKPRGRNRVQVYDAVMALPKEYKAVFVADLLEKSFPQPVTEDPLFKDAERRVLNGADPVLDERAWRLAGERYFFYMAVTRARERVYLTHSTHDDDGKPALASFFIDEARRCFAPGAVACVSKGPSDFLPGPGEWETESDVTRGLAGFLRAPADARPAFFGALEARWKNRPAYVRALEGRAFHGPVSLRDPRALEAMRAFAGPFSATGFDAFFKCAFRHFAESLLRLRRPPEGYEDAEIGNVLHEVLHDYFSAMPPARLASGDYWKTPGEMEREMEGLLDARLAAAFREQPLYRRAMFRDSMLGMLKGFAVLERRTAAEGGLTPSRFEYAFGKGSADYLRIPDESGEILLKGSIDRIDIDPSGRLATVIDYKKSSRRLKEKLKKGEEIQLPLYSYAAKKLLGLQIAGIQHRILKTGRSEDPGLTPAELETLMAETESRVREAVRRIRRGEISVEPKECDFCPFDAVCRIDARKDRRAY